MLAFSEARAPADLSAKSRLFDDAERWNHRILDVDPKNKEAWYSLGVTVWSRAYTEFQAARER